MADLAKIRHIVLDMDGTIYHEEARQHRTHRRDGRADEHGVGHELKLKGFEERFHQAENPKSEIRNPKQIRKTGNGRKTGRTCSEFFPLTGISEFVSDFDIRTSDFPP